jgi:hypothetical protein
MSGVDMSKENWNPGRWSHFSSVLSIADGAYKVALETGKCSTRCVNLV